MKIDCAGMHFRTLNDQLRNTQQQEYILEHCCGQRYIASGMKNKKIAIYGTPGNALGSYLDGGTIHVYGNAQDAAGDTMNDGTIYIHGSSGDATGYAMRGGKIFVDGDVGYRAGIHMKEYKEKVPVLVIGGTAGSFLGEYQAGGTILVLGLNHPGEIPVANFCGTGMHGGRIYLRCDRPPVDLPPQVIAVPASQEDMMHIAPFIYEFCDTFHHDAQMILDAPFLLLTPDTKNPYKQLYTPN